MNTTSAFQFFSQFILDQKRTEALKARGFSVNGLVSPAVFECLGAVLFDKRKQEGYGADLGDIEVKSIIASASSVEYQYHRESGETKLRHDMTIDHCFIFYGNEYQDMEILMVKGEVIAPTMRVWLAELLDWYSVEGHQRFRKNIKSKFIRANGQQLMRVIHGKLLDSD